MFPISGEKIQPNKLIKTFAKFGRVFSVSFDFFADQVPDYFQKYANILLVRAQSATSNRDHGYYAPGIKLYKSYRTGKPLLAVFSSVNGHNDYKVESQSLPLKTWISVCVEQRKSSQSSHSYSYRVLINGKPVHTKVNHKPLVFHNVQVVQGMSKGFSERALNGRIRYLKVTTSDTE